jgi:site-specific DNA recombinase
MTPRGWAIYTRVSSDEQAEEGVSLPAQLATCRVYAAERGWRVDHELVDDGYTGRNTRRPGYQKLLALMEARDIAGVICWKLKRLNRNSVNSGLFVNLVVKTGAELVATAEHWDTTTPTGRAMIGVASIFAQLESEDTGEQTKAAIKYLRGKGYYTGGTIPAGCRVEKVDDDKRRRLVPSEHADAIRPAWGWVLTGASLLDVARRLRAEGIPAAARLAKGKVSKKAVNWTPLKVRALLLSSQALVRAELAKRARPMRQGQRVKPGKRSEQPSPLAGLLRCPTCERPMHQITAYGRTKGYRYFRCTLRNKDRCQQSDLKAEPIEAEVIAAVAAACQEGGEYQRTLREALVTARATALERTAEQEALRQERAGVTARIATMTKHQDIGGSAWAAAMRSLGAELDVLDQRLATIAGSLAVANVDAASLDYVLAELAKGAANLPTMTVEQQALALRTIMHAVCPKEEGTVLDLYEPETSPPPVAGAVRAESQLWGSWRHGKRTIRVVVARPIDL